MNEGKTKQLELNSYDLEEVKRLLQENILMLKKGDNLNEWISLKEGAVYAGVCLNTFKMFREHGLKVCEIQGVKRVSKKEIDRFLIENSC